MHTGKPPPGGEVEEVINPKNKSLFHEEIKTPLGISVLDLVIDKDENSYPNREYPGLNLSKERLPEETKWGESPLSYEMLGAALYILSQIHNKAEVLNKVAKGWRAQKERMEEKLMVKEGRYITVKEV